MVFGLVHQEYFYYWFGISSNHRKAVINLNAIIKGELKEKSKKRGFAGMDKELQSRIASRGGKRAHVLGKAHQWTPEEARKSGHLGGVKRAEKMGQR
jgi:uncharacterized protein